ALDAGRLPRLREGRRLPILLGLKPPLFRRVDDQVRRAARVGAPAAEVAAGDVAVDDGLDVAPRRVETAAAREVDHQRPLRVGRWRRQVRVYDPQSPVREGPLAAPRPEPER